MVPNVNNNGAQELTAETWWNVDRSREPRLKEGATPLMERCIRTYGWTEDFAVKVLDGYKMFLTFKKSFEDWDAKKLSPSVPVDQMWHQHILDNRNYNKDCELLVGQVIFHDPDGGLDEDAREERIKTTIGALRIKYDDDYDKEVWNFGSIRRQDREDRLMRMQQARAASRSSSDDINDSDVDTSLASSSGGLRAVSPVPLTIRVRDMTGEETFFTIKSSTLMGKVFEAYCEQKGVARHSMNFLLDGQGIYNDSVTPLMLGLHDQDQVDAMLKLRGC